MKPWLLLGIGVLIGLLAAGAILLISLPDRGVPIVLSPPPTPTPTDIPKPTATLTPIQVLIKGQVTYPGVYSLNHDSRLMDLIELAGGLTATADENRVNHVIPLRDGDYFFIPAEGEAIPETARNAIGSNLWDNSANFKYPLNINIASQEAFESLPGIGPSKAADIIAYREQFGTFQSVDDLLKVPGIGPTILESIQEYLIVTPSDE